MSVAARLAGFAALLALAFGAAAFAGSRTDIDRAKPTADEHGAEGEMEMAADPVRGLAVSDKGLTLRVADRTAPTTLRFDITDGQGRTVKDFDVEHTKRMHVIVVRRDMAGFQHLHPTQAPDGSWSVPVKLGAAGTYRVFADFSVDGEAHTLADDLTVDGDVRTVPLPRPSSSTTVDGLRVERDGLDFTVTKDGAPVALDDYLGAKGHLVALRDGDLAFLHVHPDAESLRFEADFPAPGTYRLFLQFQTTDGVVHTAEFTR
jgi:hypothetical protein